MAKFVPSSFDQAKVRDGLLKAMGFGEPTRAADKVAFFSPKRSATTTTKDQDGIPFDPDVRLVTTGTGVTVSCAVEYLDRAGQIIDAGNVKPSSVKVTLLDREYQSVKDFSYLKIGGETYVYDFTEPPVALGSIDVWIVHAKARDES